MRRTEKKKEEGRSMRMTLSEEAKKPPRCPKRYRRAPKRHPRGFKRHPRDPKGHPKRPKKHPRQPKMPPRGAKRSPREPKGGGAATPGGPFGTQDGTQDGPKIDQKSKSKIDAIEDHCWDPLGVLLVRSWASWAPSWGPKSGKSIRKRTIS